MGFTSEIFLNNKNVSSDDWAKLILVISRYNGMFNKWKIFVTVKNNQIRYYARTKCSLPATINNLEAFMLNSANLNENFVYNKKRVFNVKNESSLIDIINYFDIKGKGQIKLFEFSFIKIGDTLYHRGYFYAEEKGNIIKYHILMAISKNLLSIDFSLNKSFLYKSSPKYLDINKILHLLKNDEASSILKIDSYPYVQGNFYLNQSSVDFAKHSIVLGSSGCGKSKFLSLLVHNIYKQYKDKYKVVVIDPHASLENDIGGLGQVIDFTDLDSSINLFMNNSKDAIISTELLLSLFSNLIGSNYNSKLERVLRHSIHLLLVDNTFNFKNLRELLLDIEYRNKKVNSLKDKLPVSVIDFFLMDFNDLKTKSYGEAISPIISFIDEMEMIPVFNEEHIDKNLDMMLEDNYLTVLSLNRTRLGDKVTKTISGLVMQQLLTLIQSTVRNQHIIFIVDEVSVVENPILSRFLSESRKYNLSLVLAGQYFNQISDKLKDAIFANVINYYIFRVSKNDALSLVDNFNMKIPLDDSKEQKVKVLSELNNRECIVRISSNDVLLPAFKASTLDYQGIPKLPRNKKIQEKKDDIVAKKKGFSIGTNISLHDILVNNSSSRGEIK